MVLRQPAGLLRKVCLCAGVDWLELTCQPEYGERSVCRLPTRIRHTAVSEEFIEEDAK